MPRSTPQFLLPSHSPTPLEWFIYLLWAVAGGAAAGFVILIAAIIIHISFYAPLFR